MIRFNKENISPEFADEVAKANAPEILGEHRLPRGFSADRVAAMSPEEHAFVLDHAARMQRGHPENVMGEVQRVARGGIYSWLSEHVGDLTHRLNEQGGGFGAEFAGPKVDTALRTLNHPYGVEREHMEQMRSNGTDMDVLREVGLKYANAHRGLPVYNEPSDQAQAAAINVGKMDFTGAALHLNALQNRMADPDRFKYLMSQQGTVEFLRRKEERGY